MAHTDLKESENRPTDHDVLATTRQWASVSAELECIAQTLSHDFRAPLRAISAYAELLTDAVTGKHVRFLDHVVQASTRMDALIVAMVEYLRVRTAPIQLAPVDLAAVFGTAARRLDASRPEPVLQLDVPDALGDVRQLRELAFHLLDNATKFHSPEGIPEVRVVAEALEQGICVSVEDNGIGISDVARARELFERLHGREHYPGLGIGLPLSEAIVVNHESSLDIQTSERGTIVSFLLQRTEAGD